MAADREPVRAARVDALNGPGRVRHRRRPPRRLDAGPGPLRLRPAPAAARDLPFAKQNFVDHTVTDQTSILRFIEDNWELGRIGDQSFDEKAGPFGQFFDFTRKRPAPRLRLDPETGAQRKDAATAKTPADAARQ